MPNDIIEKNLANKIGIVILKAKPEELEMPKVYVVLFYNKEEQYLFGVNLDFGCFSIRHDISESQVEDTIEYILNTICVMSFLHVKHIAENDIFEDLFKKQIKVDGVWNLIRQNANQERSEKCKSALLDISEKLQLAQDTFYVKDELHMDTIAV